MSFHSRWLRALPATTLPYLLILSASAADSPATPFIFNDLEILGTSLELHVTTASKTDADKTHIAVLDEIERLRKLLSTYDATAQLARVNASREALPVSPELLDVLHAYERWQKTSKNAFSPNLGTLIATWKSAEKSAQLPTPDTLKKLAADTAKPLWIIDDSAQTLRRTSDATINIDSLGKGWIASHAAASARSQNPAIKGLLLNLGGDIVALGTCKLDKAEPWTITIADPQQPAENAKPLTELRLTALSVATSGGYERNYTFKDKKFSHLIDPRTGQALDLSNPKTVASATVVAPDNATANALAASLCVLGPNAGLSLLKPAGAHALIVLTDGQQIRSPGFHAFEPPATATTPKTAASQPATGTPWPKDYAVNFSLQLLPASKRANERPYLALWIEDANGKLVTTLAVWGNERKYLRDLTAWWRIAGNDAALVKSVTRATRPVGKYSFTWDGTDQAGKPVPQGKYTLNIETAFEHGGHVTKSAVLPCTTEKSTTTLAESKHFASTTIDYQPKSK